MQSRKGSVGGVSQTSASSVSLARTSSMDGAAPLEPPLLPCAASLRNVLYAQDSSVLCLKHDSLTLERRFELHTEPISFVAIDNTNPERPRVVSVDTSKVAIVWDLETGSQLAKYSSYEDIRVAAWMKNGNLVFGDSMGNVILFDPTREESISARTLFNPLTAIAPGADCRSFALGYENGSILVAALTPSFTILHTLTTTSLSPSPVTTLAWHASSSKQKSDMLAVQTRDGDLRVWSVPKSIESEDSSRVVRVLKRPDSNRRGNNWLGWSRNGRIVQYSEGASTIWDVRTKTVAWDPVPTFDNVAGICLYGPKGVLFTIGKDATVQQFSLYPPALQSNVLQRPALPPPSPPVSIDEKAQESDFLQSDTLHTDPEDNAAASHSSQDEMRLKVRRSGAIPKPLDITLIDQQHNSLGLTRDPPGSASSVESYKSNKSAKSSKSTGSASRREPVARSSRGSVEGPEPSPPITASPGYNRRPSVSTTPQPSPKPTPRFHPLRQEIQVSPETTIAVNQLSSPISEVGHLFANIKLRMVHVTYESPRFNGNQRGGLTEDDRRKEMLWCLFGWKGDIEDLIGDELDSVNARSLSALTLRMWLNDIDENSLAVLLGSDFTVPGDWLFIALAAMGGPTAWASVARAYVLKLIQRNEIHMAVVLLLAIGDKNQAVDTYINHSMYLEATLLTALLWRSDWKRISRLVRQWGEYSRDTHDTQLAARCFACAGDAPQDRPPMPQRAPSMLRQRSNSQTKPNHESINMARGASISGPSNPRATLKMTPKLNMGPGNGALKLITSFPESPREPIKRSATTSPAITGVNRFFHHAGQRSACATPIAMSAITPIDPFWQHDPFPSSALSARTMTPGTAKPPQLPSVVESSPASATPVQRLPVPAAGMKISSPIEPRTSSGFAETLSGATFGDVQRAASPPQHAQRAASPPQHAQRAASPPQQMAPAPPPPPPTTLADISQKVSPAIPLAPPNRPNLTRSQTPGITHTANHTYPTSLVAGMPRSHTAAPRLPAASLQIQWPQIDGIIKSEMPIMPQGPSLSQLRGHGRKGSLSRPSPPVPVRSFTTPQPDHGNMDSFLSLLEKNNKRLDSQRAAPRGSPRTRQESPERKRRGRPRDLSLNRGRTTEIKKTGHMRSPSTPLPFNAQAGLYREEPDIEVVEDPPEPLTGRFYGDENQEDERGRRATKDERMPYWRSPSSPPAYHTEQHAHYKYDPEDRINDEDERFYTVAPSPPAQRRRDESRGRQAHLQPSYERSPSSPLPLSPQAQLFKEMSEQVEREHEMQEQQRQPRRMIRNESRGRPPTRNWNNSTVRRSRSENTMRQWSDRLERAGAFAPSPLSRQLSTRGLPSNPRAWQDELRSPSRDRSPGGIRGRSDSRPRFMNGRETPRDVSPATRINDNPRGRSMSRRRGSDDARTAPAPPPPPHPMAQPQQYPYPMGAPLQMQFYSSPVPAEYESVGSPLDTALPQFPDLLAHRRNQSAPTALEPLIRKLPPQPPLDSPPPLPMDLPVHPALQMHLDPTLPGGKKMSEKLGGTNARSIRRVRGANDINSPIDRWGYDDDHEREHSIVVGIETEEAAVARNEGFWGSRGTPQMQQQRYQKPDYEPDYLGEMQRMRGHTKTPSIGAVNHF